MKRMEKDLRAYKLRFITIILLIGYTFLHIKLTGRYIDATFQQLVEFSARLPFGQRLLMPALARGINFLIPLEINELFLILELITISLTYLTLIKLLQQEFNPRQAQVLSWLLILLLPLVTVVNYRYSIAGEATVYYPYDTSSLLFMMVGFLCCLRTQWLYFVLLVFLATFNRESSFLLILLIPALHWQRLSVIIKPLLLSILAYGIARLIVLWLVQDFPGTLVEFHYRASHYTHFEVNLAWLFAEEHLLLFIFCFSGLPLFWFAFYDYIPWQYRPLRYVALVYFLMLLLVGNFMEARIFIEIVAILYLPVCSAVNRWLQGQEPFVPAYSGFSYYLDRYLVILVLVLVIVFQRLINSLILWLLPFS
ncbi:hypothetical protein [Legionella clemsonensis]|uniref:Transmembrane protein EpsG n=1 Tax=Legionella clemsonensis TaxID=1867846 RepID=A0A222NYH1_9GAMM|nr:hypothetical protein [Legionella clemsonensis]ASQ44642.1 hypothetical protein clem_00380 [Legionella clemsonensis]